MATSSSLFVSTIFVAIAGLASTTAFAQEATPAPEFSNFVSQKTRAEVRAELLQAIAEHRIARNDGDYQRLVTAEFVSTKSRAQVAAETREAARLGLIPNNDMNYPFPALTAEQQRLIDQAGERALSTRISNR